MQEKPILLFDVGGVLVKLHTMDRLLALSPRPLDPAEIKRIWLKNPLARELELGRCSPEDFAERFLVDFQIDLSVDAFLDEFASWAVEFHEGAEATLADLRRDYTVCCLSNTNIIHWCEAFAAPFEHAFASHEIGAIKPDADAFHYVLESLGVSASDVLFFDDTVQNVHAAADVGMRAYHTEDFIDLKHKLTELGILPLKEIAL